MKSDTRERAGKSQWAEGIDVETHIVSPVENTDDLHASPRWDRVATIGIKAPEVY